MPRDYHAGMQTNSLPAPAFGTRLVKDSNHLENGAFREASTASGHDNDRLRSSAYVLVALVALFAGYLLGLLGGQPSKGSRVDWPSAPVNPRSFNP
jgi:hypothetical protein